MRESFARFSREHERRAETVVRKCQAWIEVQSEFKFRDRSRILAAQVARSPKRTVCAGIVAIERDGLLRKTNCLLAILIRRLGEAIDDLVVIRLGNGRIRRAKLGIRGNGGRELLS